MFLNNFTVRGFRSLTDVAEIPISGPTILAGHNDGGKSAVLTALAFLLGKYSLVEEDRTYLQSKTGAPVPSGLARCNSTEVEGCFTLDEWEQETFGLPSELRLRRQADADLATRVEHFVLVPRDERLRDLSRYKVSELADLVQALELDAASKKKADLQAALQKHASENCDGMDWLATPPALQRRRLVG